MHANDQLRTVLRATRVETDSEADYGLPTLADGEYHPYARPASKPIHTVHFISAKGEVRSFQYIHLDSDSRYTAGKIELRFIGMEPVRVVIQGRNLWRAYDYIHQHRTAWIVEAARDFANDGQSIVTLVKFE